MRARIEDLKQDLAFRHILEEIDRLSLAAAKQIIHRHEEINSVLNLKNKDRRESQEAENLERWEHLCHDRMTAHRDDLARIQKQLMMDGSVDLAFVERRLEAVQSSLVVLEEEGS